MPVTEEKKTKVEEKKQESKPKVRCISSRSISNAEQIEILKRLPISKDVKKQMIAEYIKRYKY